MKNILNYNLIHIIYKNNYVLNKLNHYKIYIYDKILYYLI